MANGINQVSVALAAGVEREILPNNPNRRGLIMAGTVAGGGYWVRFDGLTAVAEQGIFIPGGNTQPTILLPSEFGDALTGAIRAVTSAGGVSANIAEIVEIP